LNLLSTLREAPPAGEINLLTAREKLAMLLGLGVPALGFVAAVILFWGHGVGWMEISLLVGMYALTVFGIDVGYHRLFTHRAFECTRPVKYLLGVMGSMALQGPVIKWVAIHRRHHQQSDRQGDPHSPHLHGHNGLRGLVVGMWHSHMGWLFDADPVDISRSVNDLLTDPTTSAVDRLFWLWVILGLLIPAACGLAISHSAWGAFSGFLWGGLARICVMHHATFSINSVCHIWGAQPFQASDESRNNPICGLVCFGEGWHNNHHAFPTSARHGLAWWQIDIAWYFIKLLKVTGLAWNVRVPTQSAMIAKRRVAEPSPQPSVLETIAE
jgi:stearoyl-CoA desaturase (Delta-9 desaturase)